MNTLILGGEGFIGRTICKQVEGVLKCISISRRPSKFRLDTDLSQLVVGDPYKDNLSTLEFECVIHLIDNRDSSYELEKDETALINNIRMSQCKFLVLVSSAAVYTKPQSPYSQRKKFLESFYEGYCENNGIKLCIVRIFNVFGPYQIPYVQGSFVANIFSNYLMGKETLIHNAATKRDYIFSEDVARVIDRIIASKYEGIVDLGEGHLMRLGDIVRAIEVEVLQSNLLTRIGGETECVVCPAAKLNAVMDDFEFTPRTEALKKTYKFYLEHRDYLNRLV